MGSIKVMLPYDKGICYPKSFDSLLAGVTGSHDTLVDPNSGGRGVVTDLGQNEDVRSQKGYSPLFL
jgi:hypothetical protein